MTHTVDDVLTQLQAKMAYVEVGGVTVCSHPHGPCEDLIQEAAAEILALRAERDALRAAVVDTEYWSGSRNWHTKHAAAIARAREAGE